MDNWIKWMWWCDLKFGVKNEVGDEFTRGYIYGLKSRVGLLVVDMWVVRWGKWGEMGGNGVKMG